LAVVCGLDCNSTDEKQKIGNFVSLPADWHGGKRDGWRGIGLREASPPFFEFLRGELNSRPALRPKKWTMSSYRCTKRNDYKEIRLKLKSKPMV
jgi:hypothetical protein